MTVFEMRLMVVVVMGMVMVVVVVVVVVVVGATFQMTLLFSRYLDILFPPIMASHNGFPQDTYWLPTPIIRRLTDLSLRDRRYLGLPLILHLASIFPWSTSLVILMRSTSVWEKEHFRASLDDSRNVL